MNEEQSETYIKKVLMNGFKVHSWKTGDISERGKIIEYENEYWIGWVSGETSSPSKKDNIYLLLDDIRPNEEGTIVRVSPLGETCETFSIYHCGDKVVLFPSSLGEYITKWTLHKVERERDYFREKYLQIKTIIQEGEQD